MAESRDARPAGYERFYCAAHRKLILFVPRTSHGVPIGTCWDCDLAARLLAARVP